MPALISDQLRKSVLGLLAYLLVSKTSTMEKLSDRQHEAIRRARAGELVDVGVDLLNFAAEIDGLPEESALHAHVGVG